MGASSTRRNVTAVLSALESLLRRERGGAAAAGAVAAADAVYGARAAEASWCAAICTARIRVRRRGPRGQGAWEGGGSRWPARARARGAAPGTARRCRRTCRRGTTPGRRSPRAAGPERRRGRPSWPCRASGAPASATSGRAVTFTPSLSGRSGPSARFSATCSTLTSGRRASPTSSRARGWRASSAVDGGRQPGEHHRELRHDQAGRGRQPADRFPGPVAAPALERFERGHQRGARGQVASGDRGGFRGGHRGRPFVARSGWRGGPAPCPGSGVKRIRGMSVCRPLSFDGRFVDNLAVSVSQLILHLVTCLA